MAFLPVILQTNEKAAVGGGNNIFTLSTSLSLNCFSKWLKTPDPILILITVMEESQQQLNTKCDEPTAEDN